MAVFALAGAAAACTLLVPLDAQQCSTNEDCLGRGGPFAGAVCSENHVCVVPGVDAGDEDVADAGPDTADAHRGPWDCIDDPPQASTAATLHGTVVLFNALKPITTAGQIDGGSDFDPVTYTPVPGLTLRACNALDPLCGNPVAGPAVSNEAGAARLDVLQNFNGLFQIRGDNFLPSALYPGSLLAGATEETYPSAVLGKNDVALLAAAIGVPLQTDPDAGVGHAFFQVYDCFDHTGPGVSFTMDTDGGSQTVQWYTKNELPSTTATETDRLGAGGAVNVPVGGLTVHATLNETHRELGLANVVISPASTTFTWIRVRTH
jgi:hypothetical protein